MYWSNHVDHVKPASSFDVLKGGDSKEAFNWKNNQLLLKNPMFKKVKFYFVRL